MMLESPADSAILPSEIREAIRRFTEQNGPFSPFMVSLNFAVLFFTFCSSSCSRKQAGFSSLVTIFLAY